MMRPGPRRWLSLLASVAAVVAAVPTGLRAQGLFRDLDAERIPLPSAPFALTSADLDGDGFVDLVTTHPSDASVRVLLASPNGEFTRQSNYAVGLSPIFVTTGDMDGAHGAADQSVDLLTVDSGSSTLSLLRSRGDGTFLDAASYDVSLSPRAAEIGDLDGDGDRDVVSISDFAGRDVGVYTVFLNEGIDADEDGRLRLVPRRPVSVGDNPHTLVLDDFDGDDILDLAIAHTSTIAWFRGHGDGGFAEAIRTSDRRLGNPRTIAGGDFDGDGLLDLASTSDVSTLSYLRFTPTGEFELSDLGRTGISGFRVGAFLRSFDVDKDGHPDLLTQVQDSSSFGLRVLLGGDDGSFELPRELFLDALSSDVAVLDANGDGMFDVALARPETSELVVVLARAPGEFGAALQIPMADAPKDVRSVDADGDGALDIVVRGFVELSWLRGLATGEFEEPRPIEGFDFPQDFAVGDFDSDGVVDLAVLGLVAARIQWGELPLDGGKATPRSVAVQEFPRALVSLDVDGDAWTDFLVASRANGDVLLLRHLGSPDGPTTERIPVGDGQAALAHGDFDGDGFVDAAVGLRDGLTVLLGDGESLGQRRVEWIPPVSASLLDAKDLDGDGRDELVVVRTFGEPSWIVSDVASADPDVRRGPGLDLEIRAIEIADLDRDGNEDLLLGTTVPFSALRVFRGVGSGQFSDNAEVFLSGSDPQGLAIADWNGDGANDCAIAHAGSSSVDVLFGTASSVDSILRGDANVDGRVDISDPVATLERLFLAGPPLRCPDAADSDDDGALALTDAIRTLSYLFRSGSPPASPGPTTCGVDPTADALPECSSVRCPDAP